MSYCDCDFESPSLYNERRRLARKEHKCSECRGRVNPGERYLSITGIWDGDFRWFKRCADCEAVLCDINKLEGEGWCWCVALGGLAQEIANQIQSVHADLHGVLLPIVAGWNVAVRNRGGRGVVIPDWFGKEKP